MNIIISALDKINKFLLSVAAVFICVSTFFAAINAILRFTVGAGVPWSEELCSYLIVMLVFIAISYLEYTDKQLSIGILNNFLKNDLAKRVITIIRGLITMGFLGMLFYYGLEVTQKAYERNTVTFVLQMPRFILYGIVTVCFAIAIISWIVNIIIRKGEIKDVF